MRRCKDCKIEVLGNRKTCPLCHNRIDESELFEPSPFPDIPLRFSSHLTIKILSFISIVLIVIAFSINWIFSKKIDWAWFVVFGVFSMSVVTLTIVRKRRNLAKGIVYQIIILSALLLLWDNVTGYRGWSVTYGIPFLNCTAICAMFIAVRIVQLEVGDYILYLGIAGLFGIIPILFIAFQWVFTPIPSVISIALSIILLTAILIFHGSAIYHEIRKRIYL